MKRVFALAAVLVVLGVGTAFLAGEVGAQSRVWLRWLVFFGLPLAAGAAGALLVAKPARAPAAGGRRLVLLALVLAGLDLLPIGAGFLLHLVTFTYGDQTLAASKVVTIALGLPAAVLVTATGWELGLRERVLGGARAAGSAGAGWVLSILAGVALSLVAFVPGFEAMDRSFAVAALGTAALREATAAKLWTRGGRWISGFYRGALAGIEGLVIADWASFWFPSANFVSSDPRFAAIRLAGPGLGLVVAWWATSRVKTGPA